nr:DUF3459 domain-containing protein [Oscillospiraceae bacterium]
IPRFGSTHYWKRSGKLLATLLLTLRGTPFIYQGQEIGMTGFDFTSMEQVNDIESRCVERILKRHHIPKGLRWKIIARTSRDNARTPFQWDGGRNAGFSDDHPWLDINRNYKKINLDSQLRDPGSIWSWYKDLCDLRQSSAILRRGEFMPLEATDQVFAYRRELHGQELTVALNFSDSPARTGCRGTLVRSNCRRQNFDGKLQPWEAVILDSTEEGGMP